MVDTTDPTEVKHLRRFPLPVDISPNTERKASLLSQTLGLGLVISYSAQHEGRSKAPCDSLQYMIFSQRNQNTEDHHALTTED